MQALFAAALLLIIATASAPAAPLKGHEEHLRFMLIVSRHGVRAPLTPAIAYSAQPWAEWEVPLGHLTPHGADALRQMGTYMRQDLANHELVPASGCPVRSAIYLYSDTDERNISITHATFDAFAPGCAPLPVHTVDPKTSDPLFRTAGLFPPPPDGTNARRAALMAETPNVFSPEARAQLELLAHILAPDPVRPAKKSIFGPSDQPPADPADIIAANGPRSIASEIVEDLWLEYLDDKPLEKVGWGRVDEATLRKLMPIRVAAFNVERRTPFFARTTTSNLLAHILKTLDQAASNVAIPGALGSPGTRLVYISGHDGDLTGIGGLLGLHWTADGNTDDTPPDSQIVFELWQRAGSDQYTVRIRYRAQTLDQLRDASILTSANSPAEVLLTPTGCTSPISCSFRVLRKLAIRRLNPTYVRATLTQSQVAP
jgi:4-phytase/acid phosphatase